MMSKNLKFKWFLDEALIASSKGEIYTLDYKDLYWQKHEAKNPQLFFLK